MRFGRDVTRTWRLSTATQNLTNCIRKSARTEKLHRRTEDGIQQIRRGTSGVVALSTKNAADARRFAGKKLRTTCIFEAGKRITYQFVQSTRRDIRFEPAC